MYTTNYHFQDHAVDEVHIFKTLSVLEYGLYEHLSEHIRKMHGIPMERLPIIISEAADVMKGRRKAAVSYKKENIDGDIAQTEKRRMLRK